MSAVLKIGHRGACGHAPENTLLSAHKALELGCDGFEFDIQLSREGIPVVIHDDTLERTTNASGVVAEHTLAQLQALDAGRNERIPTLSEMLDFVDRRCMLFIELKAPGSHAPVAAILEEYMRKGWSYGQLIVCSFDHTQIQAIRGIDPQIQTCALLAGIPVTLAEIAAQAGAWGINPAVEHMSRALVEDAHARNLRVIAWTCNTPRQVAYARALEVDGIISDVPEIIEIN